MGVLERRGARGCNFIASVVDKVLDVNLGKKDPSERNHSTSRRGKKSYFFTHLTML